MKLRHPAVLLSLLALGLAGTGCQTYRDQASSMRDAWAQGRYLEAADQFARRADKKHESKDGVIWHLEAGAVLRALGRYPESNQHFDQAAAQIEAYEQQAEVRLGNEVGATLSNQQSLPYEGRPYDKIMLHTYKALNYLALGEIEKARPELIRAYQRQQEAVTENARRIAQAREEQQQSQQREAVERAGQDPKLSAQLQENTRNLEGFKVYADYVNPFTVFLDGIYFLHAGAGSSDRERALKSLNRVIEVTGENSTIRADLQALANPTGLNPNAPLTYVILETGRAATRDQVRIDVPIIIADVSYVGAAFPKLEFHDDFLSGLKVTRDGVQASTEPLASMDAIIALDFKNEWPAIVTKTLIATVAKGAAAYGVNTAARQADDMAGLLARIGTAIYQAAVNIADTRSWSTLPKEFQVARFPTPENRTLALAGGAGQQAKVTLLDGTVNVVYVRSVNVSSPLLVSQFILK
ncbi:MAG: hypothetical protein MUE94_02670 [Verrucomicrobia bacterium]|jgi:hypothetical protein|nr:hypothetical protein [Verrucomicrobiota bacterium]